MPSNEELLTRLMDRVGERIVNDLHKSIAASVQQEIQKNISRALVEGEFFRRVNAEMQEGLKSIYKEISSASKNSPAAPNEPAQEKGIVPSRSEADEIFTEASRQLDEILTTTETATVEIMDIVERQMDLQARSAELLGSLDTVNGGREVAEELVQANSQLGEDLMRLMTSLSFQDLTGQRIKRIIDALKKVERITFELYMTTGLKLQAHEENPEKDIEELEADTRQKVSELKGPQSDGVSQKGVDDLLSQLGLE